MTEADTRSSRWYCGPPEGRTAYVIDDITGMAGGEGTVVRATRNPYPGDAVGYTGPAAVKVLTDVPPERIEAMRGRWARLAQLRHPRVSRALEVFEGPGLFRTAEPPPDAAHDVFYATTVWAEGHPLRRDVPLPPAAAVQVALDLADGLDALHRHGLVHRDLHPGNVVVDDGGRAVLIDLGSARPDDGSTTATVTGVIGFLPPDLVNGVGTAATDRWGLGMLTVFALLGHPQGSTPADKLADELADAVTGIANPRRAVQLLMAMVDADPARRPPHGVSWARNLHACLEASPRRRLTPGVAAAAVALAALIGTTALWLAGDPVGEEAAEPVAERCPSGAPTDTAPGDPRARLLATEIDAVGLCPDGELGQHFQALTRQVVDEDGEYQGVVVLAPDAGEAVHLPPVLWFSYLQRAGVERPNTDEPYGGYPTAVRHVQDPEAVVVDLDSGGQLIGRRADSQLFWMPARAMGLWEDSGGLTGSLGFPTTDPYWDDPVPGVHLEFERGSVHVASEEIDDLLAGRVVHPRIDAEDGPALLGPVDPLRQRIIRQRTPTSWWVDADLVRHWIPDRATFRCLGGANMVARRNMAGSAVAALPLGEPAVCP